MSAGNLRKPEYSGAIDEVAGSFRYGQLLFTAVRLGIFDHLEQGPLSATELAKAVDGDPRGVRLLANALTAAGFLEKNAEAYSNSELVTSEISSRGENRKAMLLSQAGAYERWSKLYDIVKTGTRPEDEIFTPELKFSEELFARAMREASENSARVTADELDLSETKRVLDIGGGIGAYAVEFAKRNPNIHVTLVDKEKTVELARENLAAQGVLEKVTLCAGDFFETPFDEGFDFILLSNILHLCSPERAAAMVKKCAAALVPGGVLCVKDFSTNSDATEPLGSALFAIHMLLINDGECYTFEQIQAWCKQAELEVFSTVELLTQSRTYSFEEIKGDGARFLFRNRAPSPFLLTLPTYH